MLLRQVGFSLRDIKAFVEPRGSSSERWRTMAHRKLAELDQQIARAGAARDALEHALRCGQRDLRACPTFAGVLAATLDGEPLARAHAH